MVLINDAGKNLQFAASIPKQNGNRLPNPSVLVIFYKLQISFSMVHATHTTALPWGTLQLY